MAPLFDDFGAIVALTIFGGKFFAPFSPSKLLLALTKPPKTSSI